MNRLVLIGNGFDLAHGLKTSYADFINWYWEEWGKRLAGSGHKFEEDEFCSFTLNERVGLGGWYLVRSWYYQSMNMELAEFVQKAKEDTDLCEFKYKSPFFEQINKSIENKGWVDIEREYYIQLTNVNNYLVVNRPINYQSLNHEMDYLREELVKYLKSESQNKISLFDEIKAKIFCPIKKDDLSVTNQAVFFDGISWGEKGLDPSNIMLLNFNYTNTALRYIEDSSNITINHIHGRIEIPDSVIFGYGDELDKDFPRLKELNNNECLRHVKSINYLESANYKKMLEFIESDSFQVCIMGHSCGNSDRTLLNTIFEHPNCVSIKPYYYINKKQQDNYLELVQNIYRNFTDLKLMRDKVVNKTYTEPLT